MRTFKKVIATIAILMVLAGFVYIIAWQPKIFAWAFTLLFCSGLVWLVWIFVNDYLFKD